MNIDDLWDYDNPDLTEAKFRQVLPELESSSEESYLELLTQIARAQGLQGKFAEADRTLDEVEKVLDNADSSSLMKARIRYLLERGRVLNSSAMPEDAKPFFQEAFELAKKSKEDFFAVDAAHMTAIAEPLDKQYEWNQKALEIVRESSDVKARKWAASLYNNMGWTFFDQKQYGRALDCFQEALKHRIEDGGTPNQIRIAKWSVAKCLRVLDHVNEALQIQRELLGEYERIGQKDGYVYEELGECLLVFGQNHEARRYFALAYDELSKDRWLASNEPERLERLRKLSLETRSSDFSYSTYS